MRFSHVIGAVVGGGLSLLLAAAPANAAFMQGSIGFIGTFDNLPGPGSSSVVSDLNFFDLNNVTNAYAPGTATSDFAGVTSGNAVDFDLSAATFTIFTAENGTTFTFVVDTIQDVIRTGLSCGSSDNCTDSIALILSGNVFATDPALDATRFTGSFTGNGNCIGNSTPTCESDITATWSATLTANETPAEIPAPAALLLLGTSLLGFGLLRKKTA